MMLKMLGITLMNKMQPREDSSVRGRATASPYVVLGGWFSNMSIRSPWKAGLDTDHRPRPQFLLPELQAGA